MREMESATGFIGNRWQYGVQVLWNRNGESEVFQQVQRNTIVPFRWKAMHNGGIYFSTTHIKSQIS